MGMICSTNYVGQEPAIHGSPGTSRSNSKYSDYSYQKDRREKRRRNLDSISLPSGKKRKCIIQMTSAIIRPHYLRRITDKYVAILTICITIPGSRQPTIVLENPVIQWDRLQFLQQVPEKVPVITGQGTTHIFAVLNNSSTHNADISMSAMFENKKVNLVSTISSKYLATLDDALEFAYVLQQEKRASKGSKDKMSTDTGYLSIGCQMDDAVVMDTDLQSRQTSYHKIDSVEESCIEEFGMDQGIKKGKADHRHKKRQETNVKKMRERAHLEKVMDVCEFEERIEAKKVRRKCSDIFKFPSESSNYGNAILYCHSDSDIDQNTKQPDTDSSISCKNWNDVSLRSDDFRKNSSRKTSEYDMECCHRPKNPTPNSGSSNDSVPECQDVSPVHVKKERRSTPIVIAQMVPDDLHKRKKYKLLSHSTLIRKCSTGNNSLREIPLLEESEEDEMKRSVKGQKVKIEKDIKDGKKKKLSRRRQRSMSQGSEQQNIIEEEIIVEKVEEQMVPNVGCLTRDELLSALRMVSRTKSCDDHKLRFSRRHPSAHLLQPSLKTLRTTTFRRTKSMPVMEVDCSSR